jgi:hypothetical protein
MSTGGEEEEGEFIANAVTGIDWFDTFLAQNNLL